MITPYCQLLLDVIAAPDAPEKAAILDSIPLPESHALWEPPPAPARPGRPQHYEEKYEPPRRRKTLQDPTGRAQFLLAIHHIELSAIDLSCLLCLRGSDMPQQFHIDFLRVAREECTHAMMLNDLLSARGFPPGCRPVHFRLWDTALACRDLGEQLVVIPRFLEARGLDVTAELLPRILPIDPEAHAVLEYIYNDEQGHVTIGTTWHQWWCDHRNIPRPDHFIDRAGDFLLIKYPAHKPLITKNDEPLDS